MPEDAEAVKKACLLELIEAGGMRYESARRVGWSPAQLRRRMKNDARFAQDVLDAEETAAEPIESVLYKAALAGEPWAVKEWLKQRSKGRWGDQPQRVDVTVGGSVSLDALGALDVVRELARRVEGREALDVESWEAESVASAGEQSSPPVAGVLPPAGEGGPAAAGPGLEPGGAPGPPPGVDGGPESEPELREQGDGQGHHEADRDQ